jgi:4-amino-4-deoxy-L-arabinose transferase-like glycosyltransferase
LTTARLPADETTGRRSTLVWGAVIAAFLVAVVLTLFRLADVAGLYRDEAAFGLFAEQIQAGARPWHGYFNDYTAPLHSYLIAASFTWLGHSIWSLRISGVVLNLVAWCLYVDLVRRLFPAAVGWAAWLLATFPMFVVFARIAGENYALNGLLLVASVWCYTVANQSPSTGMQRWGYGFCGVALALGMWNHLIFVPAVVSLSLLFLVANRHRARAALPSVGWMLLGLAVGAVPKMVGMFLNQGRVVTLEGKVGLPAWPWEAAMNLLYTLGADGLYATACGEVRQPLNIILWAATAGALVWLLGGWGGATARRLASYVSAFVLLTFALTWFITPYYKMTGRTWLLPLWPMPGLLAMAVATLPSLQRWLVGTAVVAVNLVGLGMNYFDTFLETGGRAPYVYSGGRNELGADFMEVRPTVARLVAAGDHPIYLQDYTNHRLEFLLPLDQRARLRPFPPTEQIGTTPFEPGALVALWRSGEYPDEGPLGLAWCRRERALDDDHYVVYRVERLLEPEP